jgi:CBS domain-containing protein
MGAIATAQDIMTVDTLTVRKRDPVLEVAKWMLAQGISTAPVIEVMAHGEALVGFVSEKDVMLCFASGQIHSRPEITIAQIMRPHPVCVRPAADLFALAAIFMQHGFRHLPVVEGITLRGVVSRRDVVRGLLEHYEAWLTRPPADRRLPESAAIFTPQYLVG